MCLGKIPPHPHPHWRMTQRRRRVINKLCCCCSHKWQRSNLYYSCCCWTCVSCFFVPVFPLHDNLQEAALWLWHQECDFEPHQKAWRHVPKHNHIRGLWGWHNQTDRCPTVERWLYSVGLWLMVSETEQQWETGIKVEPKKHICSRQVQQSTPAFRCTGWN